MSWHAFGDHVALPISLDVKRRHLDEKLPSRQRILAIRHSFRSMWVGTAKTRTPLVLVRHAPCDGADEACTMHNLAITDSAVIVGIGGEQGLVAHRAGEGGHSCSQSGGSAFTPSALFIPPSRLVIHYSQYHWDQKPPLNVSPMPIPLNHIASVNRTSGHVKDSTTMLCYNLERSIFQVLDFPKLVLLLSKVP